jgi:hypothetical protein
MQGDNESWGKLATMILVGAGFVAIVVDVILYKRIKNISPI